MNSDDATAVWSTWFSDAANLSVARLYGPVQRPGQRQGDSTTQASNVDALYQELDRSLRHAERSLRALREVGITLLGCSSEAGENRAIVSAQSDVPRQRLEEFTARYEALRAEFMRTRATTEAWPTATVGRVEPAVVRRAVSYIQAHVKPSTTTGLDPTTTADIAVAAGVGVRALQQAFRRHRGTTPTGYLRDLRFERAHQELQAAEPSDSVAAIAARWGFSHPSHFAADYRRRYGQSPRDTLNT